MRAGASERTPPRFSEGHRRERRLGLMGQGSMLLWKLKTMMMMMMMMMMITNFVKDYLSMEI